MQALFIGQAYIDITFVADALPTGDDKTVARDYAVSAGRIVDTNGAGDIFHGAYVYSYLANPLGLWEDHFRFARAASAHAIQYLGNEASLPSLAQIDEADARFAEHGETARLLMAQSS